MGWASGSILMSEVIAACNKEFLNFEYRKVFYKILIKAMEGEDWDTQLEFIGEDEAFDEAFYELHPDWRE